MKYQVPLRLRITRFFLRPVFRFLFHILSSVKITGMEDIPKDGGYLIAINHVSIFDPPFVIAFWPVLPEAVGAVEIWSKRGQSTLVSLYGTIPIQRGGYSREALESMVSALRSGRPLVIAPEGGRSHLPGLRRGQPGVGFILEKAPVPIIPVGIVGTTEDFFHKAIRGKRPRLELNIGKPLNVDPGEVFESDTQLALAENPVARRKLSRQMVADKIMLEIAALLPREYQGVYTIPDLE